MKIVLIVLGLLVVLGAAYGLAFLGVIPVQKWADKNPSLAKTLTAMHLAKPKKAVVPAAPALKPDPQQQALDAEKQQIEADRAQLTKDRAAFEAAKQQAAAPSPAAGDGSQPGAASGTGDKLAAIYATMDPEDLAKIFAKQTDPVVIQSLSGLDEKKAGQVLAAMPADRAARLALLMQPATPKRPAAVPSPPHPATDL